MSNPSPAVKKERSHIFSAILYYGLALLMVSDQIFNTLNQGFAHDVTAFIPAYAETGRIPLRDLSFSTLTFLLPGLVLSTAAIITAIAALGAIGMDALHHRFFSEKNSRRISIATMAILAYAVGLYITELGANAAAAQFHAQMWFERSTSVGPLTIVLFILFATLMTMCIITRRGLKMQQDQEGLI